MIKKQQSILEKIDAQKMRQVIMDFPKQFAFDFKIENKKNLPKRGRRFSNIIICGMGGSALPGNVLKTTNAFLDLIEIPILIHRDYGLAREANKNSLIFCISYSGNTEETISAFNEARKRNLKVCTIASGGALIKIAKKHKIPFIKVPSGIPPRCALGYQFSALVELLFNTGFAKRSTREAIRKLASVLDARKFEKMGKKLAERIGISFPLVYSSSKWGAISKIWKIKFNENSKIPSFFNFFPELNHNEMVGIGETKIKEASKFFSFLFLRDKKEDKKEILKRMEVMDKIFKNKGFKIIFIELDKLVSQRKEKTFFFFERFFSAVLLGDWVSYYLAINQEVNPTPVNLVEDFKRKIRGK